MKQKVHTRQTPTNQTSRFKLQRPRFYECNALK